MKGIDLCDYIIKRCNLNYDQKGMWVNNLKLNMVIYRTNTLFLGAFKKRLIDDEFIPKMYGPIIQEVYCKYFLWGGTQLYLSDKQINSTKSLMKINPELKSDEIGFLNDCFEYLTKLDTFSIKDLFKGSSTAYFHAYMNKDEFISFEDICLEAGIKDISEVLNYIKEE